MIVVLVLSAVALLGSFVFVLAAACDRRPSVVLVFAVALVVASMLFGASMQRVLG